MCVCVWGGDFKTFRIKSDYFLKQSFSNFGKLSLPYQETGLDPEGFPPQFPTIPFCITTATACDFVHSGPMILSIDFMGEQKSHNLSWPKCVLKLI